MKKILLAGNLPYVAVLILCVAAYFVGQVTVPPQSVKFAVAEKSAVFWLAALDMPGATSEQVEQQVKKPIVDVLRHYEDQGYVVMEAAKDEQGYFSVLALPTTVVDITEDLRSAVKAARLKNDPKASKQ